MRGIGHYLGAACLLFTLVAVPAGAQNLVPNPGFEGYSRCPRFLGNFEADILGWDCPTQGSTDYFHRCSEDMGTPENFNGEQRAAEGEGYAGFYAYAPGDYREYVQAQLAEPLEDGRQYRLRFSLSLAERSDFALNTLHVLFTAKPMRVGTKKNLARRYWLGHPELKPHQLDIAASASFADTENWMHLDTVFTARGTEVNLIIGNLLPNARTRTFRTNRRSNKGAYYYLDGIILEPYPGNAAAARESQVGDIPKDSLLVLPSLLFEFDAHQLTDAGKEALHRVYDALRSDLSLSLELRGHTDSRGAPAYNQQLSEQRCRAVARYLEGLGLDSVRIRWIGFGAARPVAGNSSESGRRRNRRVEFLIRSEDPVQARQN